MSLLTRTSLSKVSRMTLAINAVRAGTFLLLADIGKARGGDYIVQLKNGRRKEDSSATRRYY
jgi:hypothetical protein